LLAVRWYWIDGRSTASEYFAKLAMFLARIHGRDDGAIVVVYAKKDDAGRTALTTFIRDAGPLLLERTLAGDAG
jgi:EpsI family protein